MVKDIKDYVRSCSSCQMRKSVPDKPAGLMTFIEVQYPFEKVGIDLLEPFPTSNKGNKYIVVAVDYLTNWAETAALVTSTAQETAQFFVNQILLRHGAPASIISDRGKCFIAELTEKVLEIIGTDHQTTTSYHPQANGLCERLNHTLADMLSMYVNSNHMNWDEILPYITFAYNISKQEYTRYTPFYLIYGRRAVLPIDEALAVKSDLFSSNEANEDYAVRVAENLTLAREAVYQKLRLVHLQQKADYDKKRRDASFSEGELVLIYKPIRKVGRSEKLLHQWLGPYQIIRQTSDLNYEVKLHKGKSDKSDIVHKVNMKPFYPPKNGNREKVHKLPVKEQGNQVLLNGPNAGIITQTVAKRRPGRPRKVDNTKKTITDETVSVAEETESRNRRNQTRKRAPPQFLNLVQGLLLITLFGLTLAEPSTPDAVHFEKLSSVVLTASEWIVVSEVTFTDVVRSIQDFRFHLVNRAWNKTRIHASTETEEAGQHQQVNAKPSPQQVLLRDYSNKLTKNALNTLDTIQTRLDVLVNSVQNGRPQKARRGLINVCGDILKWLFGTPANQDLEKLNRKFKQVAKSSQEIVHSAEDQATVLTESLLLTKGKTKILDQVKQALASLDKDFLESRKENAAMSIEFM